MCLTTRKFSPKLLKKELEDKCIKIATRNITVYKTLYKFTSGYTSPYQYYVYKEGKRYKSVLTTHKGDAGVLLVHKGLHSWRDKSMALAKAGLSESRLVAVMTIPKGAKYILGIKGDIVSNQLIWDKGLLNKKSK